MHAVSMLSIKGRCMELQRRLLKNLIIKQFEKYDVTARGHPIQDCFNESQFEAALDRYSQLHVPL